MSALDALITGENSGSTDWFFATAARADDLSGCHGVSRYDSYRRRARVPRIRTGNADVRGSLSKEVIRRVIQRHINEVRFCYAQALTNPKLKGRINIELVISRTGAVQTATISQSDMGSPAMETCIAEFAQRWSFPAPDNRRTVVVNYPFMLDMMEDSEYTDTPSPPALHQLQ